MAFSLPPAGAAAAPGLAPPAFTPATYPGGTPTSMRYPTGVDGYPGMFDGPARFTAQGKGNNPVAQFWGIPIGEDPKTFAYKDFGNFRDNESRFNGRPLDLVTNKFTFSVVLAQGQPLLTQIARFTITENQNIQWTQTEWNIAPAEPMSVQGLARFSGKSMLQYSMSGQRRGAAAQNLMETLRSSEGPAEAEMMTRLVSASLQFDQQQLVLKAMIAGGRLRYWRQTNGDRMYRMANADRQLLDEVRMFGAFNRGFLQTQETIARIFANVRSSGTKIMFLPYNIRDVLPRLNINDSKPELGQIHIEQSEGLAEALFTNQIDRQQFLEAAPTEKEAQAFTINNNSSYRIYAAPPASLDGKDHEALGLLDSTAVVANYWRPGLLGDGSVYNKRPGFMRIFNDERNVLSVVGPELALSHLGCWSNEHHIDPHSGNWAGLYSKNLHNYVNTLNANQRAMELHAKYGTSVSNAAGLGLQYYTDDEAKKDLHVFPLVSYFEHNGLGEYFIPRDHTETHPFVVPHSLTTYAARDLKEKVTARVTRGSDVSIDDAFRMLDRCVHRIMKAPYSRAWIQELREVNNTFVVGPDGAYEVQKNSYGGLNIPVMKDVPKIASAPAGPLGAGIAAVEPLLPAYLGVEEQSFLYGFWTGPGLRTIASMPESQVDKWPEWCQQIYADLQKCLPVFDKAMNDLSSNTPQTGYLSPTLYAPWYDRSSIDHLTPYVAYRYGDTPLYIQYGAVAPGLASRVAAAVARSAADAVGTASAGAVAAPVAVGVPGGVATPLAAAFEKPQYSAADVQKLLFTGDVLITSDAFKRVPGAQEAVRRAPDIAAYTAVYTGDASRANVMIDPVSTPGVRVAVANLFNALSPLLPVAGISNADWRALMPEIFSPAESAVPTFPGADAAGANNATVYYTIGVILKKLDALTSANGKPLPPNEVLGAIVKSPIYQRIVTLSTELQKPTAAGVALEWCRTPLGYVYVNTPVNDADIAKPGNPDTGYTTVLPNGRFAGRENLFRSFTSPALDAQALLTVYNARVTAGVGAIGAVGGVRVFVPPAAPAPGAAPVPDTAFTSREANFGLRPHAPNAPGADVRSGGATLLQTQGGSLCRRAARLFRHQLYNATSKFESPFFQACWLAYMYTPTTHEAYKTFIQKNVVLPFDLGYFRLSQVFMTSDAVAGTPGCVQVFMDKIAGYVSFGNMHKTVYLQANKRTMEWVPDPELVYHAPSIYVRELISGRNVGFVKPDKKYALDSFFRRDVSENILPVMERVCQPWAGVLHVENDISDQYIKEATDNRGRLRKSYYSSQAFVLNHAFEGYFENPRHTYNIKSSRSGQTGNLADDMTAQYNQLLASRQTPCLMNPYMFRGYCYEANNETGELNREMPGDEHSPLGDKFWNMEGTNLVMNSFSYKSADSIYIAGH